MNFNTLGLNESIIKGLAMQGIEQPTKVQEQAIPLIMENKNIVIQSETGSGKTLAYLLPIYMRHNTDLRGTQVLVLVPTHELAMQAHRQVETLSKNSGVAMKSCTIFGDVNINTQIEKLREKPQIVIGTTGRIIELIKRKKISAHTIKTIVIDEADKMLDINNIDSVKAIIKSTMRDTQKIFLSASISEKAQKTAEEIATNLLSVKTAKTLTIPENIKHMYIVVEERDKIETFRKLGYILKPKRAIVFINNADKIDVATEKLKYHKINAESIQGSSAKGERKNVLSDFSKGKINYLIATDIASRGLHIENVEVIFSLSIPENPTDYLHRAGRTGRGNSTGISISIITEREIPLIKKYQNAFGILITQIQMREGKIIENI
ncbi:MAG: DEAD/DEAH box helicase [Oscillospiraceae bacterium]